MRFNRLHSLLKIVQFLLRSTFRPHPGGGASNLSHRPGVGLHGADAAKHSVGHPRADGGARHLFDQGTLEWKNNSILYFQADYTHIFLGFQQVGGFTPLSGNSVASISIPTPRANMHGAELCLNAEDFKEILRE